MWKTHTLFRVEECFYFSFFIIYLFWLHHTACGIFYLPDQGEPILSVVRGAGTTGLPGSLSNAFSNLCLCTMKVIFEAMNRVTSGSFASCHFHLEDT